MIHSGAPCFAAEKSLLVKLRKKTGFPVGKCKDALAKFDNNFQEVRALLSLSVRCLLSLLMMIFQAESWLRKEAQKEGWAKATKLQHRPMSQGLVALKADGKVGAMVEVSVYVEMIKQEIQWLKLHGFSQQP